MNSKAERLDGFRLGEVEGFARLHVHAHRLAALLLVVRPELDQDVDRVEPGVLPEGPGDHVERASEGLDRELFAPADRRRVILQGDGKFDLRGSTAGDRLTV